MSLLASYTHPNDINFLSMHTILLQLAPIQISLIWSAKNKNGQLIKLNVGNCLKIILLVLTRVYKKGERECPTLYWGV